MAALDQRRLERRAAALFAGWQRIAFTSNRGGSYNLYVMDADGRNVARLTDHAGNDHDPSWLPDGESLVFSSDRDRGTGRSDLYQLWLADGRVERLTVFFHGNAIMPNVSPDGGWVAFVGADVPGGFRLGLPDPRAGDCDAQTWAFDVTGPGCWPNWSPDGQTIAHVSLLREPSNIQSSFVRHRLRNRSPASRRGGTTIPDWSPDNRLLAVSVSPEHHEGENWDLAIVDPTRAMPLQRLTTGAGNDRLPDWKPR